MLQTTALMKATPSYVACSGCQVLACTTLTRYSRPWRVMAWHQIVHRLEAMSLPPSCLVLPLLCGMLERLQQVMVAALCSSEHGMLEEHQLAGGSGQTIKLEADQGWQTRQTFQQLATRKGFCKQQTHSISGNVLRKRVLEKEQKPKGCFLGLGFVKH
eukprot:6108447-Amphidinium_carterae.1